MLKTAEFQRFQAIFTFLHKSLRNQDGMSFLHSVRAVVPPPRSGTCVIHESNMNTRQTPKYSTEHEPVNTRAT